MAWKLQQEDAHFKAEWSTPMQGIDTTALAPYAQGLPLVSNFLIQNQSLIAAAWTLATFGDQGTFNTATFLIGFGEIPFPIAISGAINVQDEFFYLITSGPNATAFVANTIGTPSTNIGTVALLGNPIPGTLSWKSVNGITYLSAPGMTQILQIGNNSTGSPTLTQLTNFLGCKFIGEFNGRLIALNVSQWQPGPPLAFAQNFPFQIAWSAGGQQYGIWNPLDISGNATGAGFNNLPDVEDEITGALFIGPTVYIIRRAGITEMTALNSGIQPFNFDHMWASHKGVGTVFPETIAQYGPKGGFVAKDDIYTIGLDGINTIGGSAKRAIYSDIQAAFNVQSSMVSLQINGAPELCYILALQIEDTVNNIFIIRSYVYGFETKQWMCLTFANGTSAGNVSNLIQIQSLLMSNIITTTFSDLVSCDGIVIVTQGTAQVPKFYYIPLLPSNSASIGSSNQSQLVFPHARVQTLKDITIDSVVFYCEGQDGSTVQPIIDGIPYTLQTLGTGPDSAKNLYTAYPLNQAAQTGLQPQLTIEASGTLAFGEISMEGTIGPGRRP